MVVKYPSIYKAIQKKVLQTKKFTAVMNIEEYGKIFFDLCNDQTE